MRGSNQVDIMAMQFVLQIYHSFRQFGAGYLILSLIYRVLADLIVLAKETLAGTAAEKDRPGTFGSREGRLFPEMRAHERNAASRALPAKTQRLFRAVDFTITRTQGAVLIQSKRIHKRSARDERLESFRKKAQEVTRR